MGVSELADSDGRASVSSPSPKRQRCDAALAMRYSVLGDELVRWLASFGAAPGYHRDDELPFDARTDSTDFLATKVWQGFTTRTRAA